MDGDLYGLTDGVIAKKVGEKLKSNRLKQNVTQRSLSEASGVPLSTLKRIEGGEIGAFDSLLRMLRVLGMLDCVQPLVEEEQLSPQEYYELVHGAQKKRRKRAVGRLNPKNEEESEW